MRILGICPNCGGEDSLRGGTRHQPDAGHVTCESCHREWPDWMTLIDELRRDGQQVYWVDVAGSWPMVEVWHNRVDWPARRAVVCVLNAAIIEYFGLRVTFAAEGGVEGVVDDEPIELRNLDDKIGLFDEYQFPDHLVCRNILEWYSQLLRILFEDALIVNGHDLGRGRVLKLDPTDANFNRDVLHLLWLAMFVQTEQADFPGRVFARLEVLSRTLGGSYLAGLTPEEVVAFYVPPPA